MPAWCGVGPASSCVFVFPGHLPLSPAAIAELCDTAEVFAAEMRRCDLALAAVTGWSLLDRVRGVGSRVRVRDTARPLLFATTVSLAAQWRSLGVEPEAVLGHSHGEIAAAHVAGALSLDEAAGVIAAYGSVLEPLRGRGGLTSIALSSDAVHRLVEPWRHEVTVAARNGPLSTIVSGPAAALDAVAAECDRRDVRCRQMPVDVALHSADMDEVREPLRDALPRLRPDTGGSVFISSVTGAGLDARILDADYWFANLRQPVLFEQAVRWARDRGYRTFVECSPQPALAAAVVDCLSGTDDGYRVFAANRRGVLAPVVRAVVQS